MQQRQPPIGAVIADICRDLNIQPGHPLWREIWQMLFQYRGNAAGLMKTLCERTVAAAMASHKWAAQSTAPPVPAPAGTGPP